MIAAAITRSKLKLKGIAVDHLEATIRKMLESGVKIETNGTELIVEAENGFNAVDVKTMPYPGFPTDMQPQLTVLLTLANGTSVVTETVFENRFMHVHELRRMGADIKLEGQSAIIRGVPRLSGAPVKVSDLRAGAALLLAALSAEGETMIEDRDRHIQRGYEKIIGKLNSINADIKSV